MTVDVNSNFLRIRGINSKLDLITLMASTDLVINFGFFKVKIVRPSVVSVSLGPVLARSYTISEGSGPVQINLGDNQFTTIHVHGLDAAKLEGHFVKPPTWTVDDTTIAMITPSADGLTCRVEAAAPVMLGTTTVHVTDTDDPNIPGLDFEVTIGAEQITSLGATVDPPTEKV